MRYQEERHRARIRPSVGDEKSKEAREKERISELRRVIQRNHPDKGGDVARFHAAMRELKGLRR